jgi:hypothetical protein
MPDSSSKSKSGSGSMPMSPSFYSQAAKMEGGGKPGAKSTDPNTPGGAAGEKVKNVKVLLEVFDKMDKLEQDQAGKDVIRQMSDLAKQYMDKLEGKGPGTENKPPNTGEAGSTPPPPPDATGGGAGAPGGDAGAGGGGGMPPAA